VTAKDFRTWSGTVLAALALREFERFDSQAAARRNLRQAIERVAARLGNTPTICRKCYVHPEVLDCYLEGALALEVAEEAAQALSGDGLAGLRPEEAAVLALLAERLKRVRGAGQEVRPVDAPGAAPAGGGAARRRKAAGRRPGTGAGVPAAAAAAAPGRVRAARRKRPAASRAREAAAKGGGGVAASSSPPRA
jgi:DNA topoisomerase-1